MSSLSLSEIRVSRINTHVFDIMCAYRRSHSFGFTSKRIPSKRQRLTVFPDNIPSACARYSNTTAMIAVRRSRTIHVDDIRRHRVKYSYYSAVYLWIQNDCCRRRRLRGQWLTNDRISSFNLPSPPARLYVSRTAIENVNSIEFCTEMTFFIFFLT